MINFVSKSTAVLTFLMAMVASVASAESDFQQLGSTVVGTFAQKFPYQPTEPQSDFVEFGSVVDLSDNGRRMAVGAPRKMGGGSVALYDLSDNDHDWKLIFELHGEPNELPIGDRISLSRDGQQLAVRRYHASKPAVEVYTFSDNNNHAVASGVAACGTSKGKAVELGNTVSNKGIEQSWLVVSCEGHADNRGRVEVYLWSSNGNEWLLFSTRDGSVAGDRFGTAVGFAPIETSTYSTINPSLFRVAVSAPNSNQNQGTVQVFDVDTQGNWLQVGTNLEGQGQFGFSLGLSDVHALGGTENTLVVGAPQCADTLGCVHVFQWRRSRIGADGWQAVSSEPLKGSDVNDRYGRAVAVSSSGTRVAASSFAHNRQTGVVDVYQVNVDGLQQLAQVHGESPMDRWGLSISLSQQGTVLASGSTRSKQGNNIPTGSVRTFVDATPFCTFSRRFESPFDVFLARRSCMFSGKVVTTEEECQTHSPICEWVVAPTTAPSAAPSGAPSQAPSASPTLMPSNSPTYMPTAEAITVSPTASPMETNPKTASPTQAPTTNLRGTAAPHGIDSPPTSKNTAQSNTDQQGGAATTNSSSNPKSFLDIVAIIAIGVGVIAFGVACFVLAKFMAKKLDRRNKE